MLLSHKLAVWIQSAGKDILRHPNISQKYMSDSGHFQRDKAHSKFLDKIWHVATPLIFSVGYSLLWLTSAV